MNISSKEYTKNFSLKYINRNNNILLSTFEREKSKIKVNINALSHIHTYLMLVEQVDKELSNLGISKLPNSPPVNQYMRYLPHISIFSNKYSHSL